MVDDQHRLERRPIKVAFTQSSFVAIESGSENTAEINAALDEVALQWAWFDNALDLRHAEAYRLVIADSGESILEMMDRETKLYEAQATP